MELTIHTDSEQLKMIAEGWTEKASPTFDELSASVLQTHQIAQTISSDWSTIWKKSDAIGLFRIRTIK